MQKANGSGVAVRDMCVSGENWSPVTRKKFCIKTDNKDVREWCTNYLQPFLTWIFLKNLK